MKIIKLFFFFLFFVVLSGDNSFVGYETYQSNDIHIFNYFQLDRAYAENEKNSFFTKCEVKVENISQNYITKYELKKIKEDSLEIVSDPEMRQKIKSEFNRFDIDEDSEITKEKINQAIKEYKEVFKNYPDCLYAEIELARAYSLLEKYTRAEKKLFDLLQKVPKDTYEKNLFFKLKIYNYLGDIYKKQADYNSALDIYYQALEYFSGVEGNEYKELYEMHIKNITSLKEKSDREKFSNYIKKAEEQENKEKYKEALKFYQKALNLKQKNPVLQEKKYFLESNISSALDKIYYHIGKIYSQLGEEKKANEMYEKQIEQNSKYSKVEKRIIKIAQNYRTQMLNLDKSEKEQEKIQNKTIKKYKKIIKKNPKTTMAYLELARVHLDLENYEIAEDMLEEALTLEKGNSLKSLSVETAIYQQFAFNYITEARDLLRGGKLKQIGKLLLKSEKILDEAIHEFTQRIDEQNELTREIKENINSLNKTREYVVTESTEIKLKVDKKTKQNRLLKVDIHKLSPEEKREAIQKRLSKIRSALALYYAENNFSNGPEKLNKLVPEYLDFLPPGDWQYDPKTMEIKSKAYPDL